MISCTIVKKSRKKILVEIIPVDYTGDVSIGGPAVNLFVTSVSFDEGT